MLLYPDSFYSVYGLFLWQNNIYLFIVDAFQKINTIIQQNFVMLTVFMKPLKLALIVWLNLQITAENSFMLRLQMFEMDHHVIFPLLQCFLFS